MATKFKAKNLYLPTGDKYVKIFMIYNAISFGICGAPVPLALKCRLRKIITISNSRKE